MKKQFNHRLFRSALAAAICGMMFTSCTKEDEVQPRLTGEDKINSVEAAGDDQARKARVELDRMRGSISYETGAQERKGNALASDSKNLINQDGSIHARQISSESVDIRTEMALPGPSISRIAASSTNAADINKGGFGKADKVSDRCMLRSDELKGANHQLKSPSSAGQQLEFTPAMIGAEKSVDRD